MPNRWIEHVRDYAARNKISYSCAVTEAKASYVKVAKPKAPRKAAAAEKPMTKNYRKKVTPEQQEHAKVVKQRILDRITY
jgi:hypothetical protein